jgi:hypothetical protein
MFKKKYNFWVFCRWINVYVLCVCVWFLNKVSTVIILFILILCKLMYRYLIIRLALPALLNFLFIGVLSFFYFKAVFCFTNPDYHLIEITSPTNQSRWMRFYCITIGYVFSGVFLCSWYYHIIVSNSVEDIYC